MVIKTNLKMIHFNIIMKSRRHFLGSVGVNVWFVFKYLIADWMNSYEQRTLIGRAERTKPKQIKWIMTCVSLNGLS